MRIALLADIHGNAAALEAALDHVARQHVDQLVVLGDIVIGSPDSAACWQRVRDLGCPVLRGNHERYVAHLGGPHGAPEWQTERFGPVQWAAQQFSAAQRATLDALPLTLRLHDAPDLLLVHGSLRNDNDTIAAYTPDAELAAMFPSVAERWIARAHNHVGQIRVWGERRVVTVGSVGLPLDGAPTAQYLILERRKDGWYALHQSVRYDIGATLRRFHETGYLESAGPMARLYLREVATASQQIVPFLREYARFSENGTLPLAESVRRFFEAY